MLILCRLLGKNGIPKLKERAKKLKFRGKGHEFSDCARLLEMYQLWLDDLFPKARFLDAAAMVEKLGHKKRIQIMRNAWIDEGRPKTTLGDEDGVLFEEPSLPARQSTRLEPKIASIFTDMEKSQPVPDRARTPVGDPLDDLFDATPAPLRRDKPVETAAAGDSICGGGQSLFGDGGKKTEDGEFEDDLDALLAEEEMEKSAAPTAQSKAAPPASEPSFDEDEAAMAEMGWDY